ncbi:MAG: hypothetical protein M0R51_17895 [Clostridia bacterium]|jgi:protein gp37|nr:hypothetical protein [Clostridia bacterium]
MGLNVSKGNMYEFVTHTWNAIKGKCPHECSYCYMHRWGKQPELHLDEKELKTNLGSGNYIFVGSSCDMFAGVIPSDWIFRTLEHCNKYQGNKYFFQSKNPYVMKRFIEMGIADYYEFMKTCSVCTTIETNRFYPKIMGNAFHPESRDWIGKFLFAKKYVTIEPILDFDLPEMVELIKRCNPEQVNIGADSGHNNLPEPPKEKVIQLIEELQKFTVINNKKNISRLLK